MGLSGMLVQSDVHGLQTVAVHLGTLPRLRAALVGERAAAAIKVLDDRHGRFASKHTSLPNCKLQKKVLVGTRRSDSMSRLHCALGNITSEPNRFVR